MRRELFHLSVLSEGSLNAFPAVENRLRAARRLTAHHGDRLLWFCVTDTHYHAVIEADPTELPTLRRDLAFVLGGLADVPFQAAHFKPIANRGHLESCFPYILGNREHHGLAGDALADPGCCLADLVGARRLPGFEVDRWQRHLPRVTLPELVGRLGVPFPRPASLDAVRGVGAAALGRAAAAAIGFPDLAFRGRAVVAARTAFVHLGLRSGLARTDLAWVLGGRRQLVPEHAARTAGYLDHVLLMNLGFADALRSPRRVSPRDPAAGQKALR